MSQVIHWIFYFYTTLLMVRIVGSWFPSFASHPAVVFIGRFTDPYLNIFRRIIPPLGGALDVSPLLAFFTLQLLEFFVRTILRC